MNDPMMQPTRIYIDGVWEKGRGEVLESLNPATGEVHWSGHAANRDDVDAAVQAAASALPDWSALSLPERIECVESFGRQLETAAEELTEVISRETGKVRWDASGEVAAMRAKIPVSISALQERRSPSEVSLNNMTGRTRYKPLGVTAVFGPFNFPGHISNGHIIPALLAGNTVVFKPSELAPASAAAMVHLWDEAGLPPGVLNLVQGGKETGSAVVEHQGIRGLFFTGSVRVGKMISRALADRLDVLVALELGGKDPAYVRADADVDAAVAGLADGAFFNSGQCCCGIERVYVHEKHFDAVAEGLAEVARGFVLGNPLEEATTLGPMAQARFAAWVREQTDEALRKGAKALVDPSAFAANAPGTAYLAPQVLVDVDHQMSVMREESFGPVVGVMKVRNDEEALALMNDSPYGLTASIWTADEQAAIALGDRLETGTVFMNRCDYLDPALVWTGVKETGKGAALSELGYLSLTRPKSYHLRLKT